MYGMTWITINLKRTRGQTREKFYLGLKGEPRMDSCLVFGTKVMLS